MKHRARVLAAVFLAFGFSGATCLSAQSPPERGRVLLTSKSCNECHTPGWRESGGTVPVERWMTGTNVGYRGPWGTVYPTNVRLWFRQIDERHWLFEARTRGGRPPMPWDRIHTLSVDDQRAIYRFVRYLGPAGKPAPGELPPWKKPATPFVQVSPLRHR